VREGGTGSYSELEEQPIVLPYRYESGTVNTVGISGLCAGLAYIFGEGLERIRAHEDSLVKRLIEGLAAIPGVSLYTAQDSSKQAPVISLGIEGIEPGEVGAILDQAFDIKVRTGLHCAPAAHKTLGTFPLGTVRLSPGCFNVMEEMDLTLEAVEKIARMKLTRPLPRIRRGVITGVGRVENHYANQAS